MTLRLSRPGLLVLQLFLNAPATPRSGATVMKATRLSSGTLYPILLRFEGCGIFQSKWEEGKAKDLGRPRQRFYSITGYGVRVANDALTVFK